MLQRFDNALRTTLHREPSALDDPKGEQPNRAADRNQHDTTLLLISHGGIQRAVAVRAGANFNGVHDNLAGLWFEYDGTNLTVSDTSKCLDPDAGGGEPLKLFAAE